MQRLDQYSIPVTIMLNNERVTPETCDDIVIKLGDYQKSYSKGEITYDSEKEFFRYPVTSEITSSLPQLALMQVAIIIDNDKILSPTQSVNVRHSIISEV